MTLTKVYQIGEILFIEEAGITDRIKIRSWNVDSTTSHIYIQNLLTDNRALGSIKIAIADVRSGSNAAIGGQTREEVENWCASPIS